MRRFAAAFGLAVLFLAGCSGLTGSSLADEWPEMPTAAPFAPKAATCHASIPTTVSSKTYSPVDCAQKHLVETLYIGELTGTVASLSAPPDLADAAAEPVYAECDKGVNAKLGRDWRDHRLDLVIHLPTESAWKSGARWVRCDVVVPRDLARSKNDDLIDLTGPLKEAELLLGCFDYKSAPGATLTGVACTQPHNAEYVGSSSMPAGTKYPEADTDWDKLHDKCFALAAAFVGVSESALTAGVSSWVENEDRWTGGDRSIRCYLWLDKKTMSASAKGSRGQGIPS